MKHIKSIIPLAISLALTGCGQSPGEKALEALRTKESDRYGSTNDLVEVARQYREVAAKYPDVAERALNSAQRVNAEIDRQNELVRKAEADLARSNGTTY